MNILRCALTHSLSFWKGWRLSICMGFLSNGWKGSKPAGSACFVLLLCLQWVDRSVVWAEALPVIGCLWQGSQLFRQTGEQERCMSVTPDSWHRRVSHRVAAFRAQMSPTGTRMLFFFFDEPSQRKTKKKWPEIDQQVAGVVPVGSILPPSILLFSNHQRWFVRYDLYCENETQKFCWHSGWLLSLIFRSSNSNALGCGYLTT